MADSKEPRKIKERSRKIIENKISPDKLSTPEIKSLLSVLSWDDKEEQKLIKILCTELFTRKRINI